MIAGCVVMLFLVSAREAAACRVGGVVCRSYLSLSLSARSIRQHINNVTAGGRAGWRGSVCVSHARAVREYLMRQIECLSDVNKERGEGVDRHDTTS